MKKTLILLPAFFILFVLSGSAAYAHVTVHPAETSQGAYEVFTVRVPTEKDVPTVKIEIKIPEEVNISRFEPKPDWEYEFTKDSTGKITSVTWTATEAGLSSTEFGEFKMNGKVADDVSSLIWKAYQTYGDGSVVEWIGTEGSDKPASVTAVNAAGVNGSDADPAVKDGQSSNLISNLSLFLSLASFLLSLIAILVVLRKSRVN